MPTDSRLWCEHGLVVVVDGPEGRVITTTEKPYVRIGSHDRAEIPLSGDGVPRRGLYLHAADAGVFCARLCADQPPVGPMRGWMLPGQSIPLGPYRISARLAGGNGFSDPTPSDLEARGSAEPPYPLVTVFYAGREVAQRRLKRRLTVVGRSHASTLPIWASDLSRPHLVLCWQGGVLWVIDLLSRNGTWLDGAAVEVAPVPLGGSVSLGQVRLTFTDLTAPAEHRPAPPDSRGASHSVLRKDTDAVQRALPPMDQTVAELLAQLSTQLPDRPREGNLWRPSDSLAGGIHQACAAGGGAISPCSTFAMIFMQWAAEQLAHEREWLELAAQRQAIEARLQEQLAAMERLRWELEGRQRALEIRQQPLALGLDVPDEQPPRPAASSAPAVADREPQSAACAAAQSADGAAAQSADGAAAQSADGEEEDVAQAYSQLLDRLIALSRQRSTWWDRVKGSFSRLFTHSASEADSEEPPPQSPAA